MSDPVTLNTIQATADALNHCGIATLEDLRLWISKDVDKGIPLLSESSHTTQSLLIALLIAEFCDDAGRSGKPRIDRYWRGLKTFPSVARLYTGEIGQALRYRRPGFLSGTSKSAWYIIRQLITRHSRLWYNWRRHWADALLILVLPLLLVSLWLRVETAQSRKVQMVTVKGSAQVARFQPITDEIELIEGSNASKVFSSVEDVRGRYALVSLPSGAVLRRDQILSAELSNKMKNRIIFSVPLKEGAYIKEESSPPSDSVLILSARDVGSRGNVSREVDGAPTPLPQLKFNIVLLAIDKIGETSAATVAIPPDDFDKVIPLLGSHDAYLSRIVR